MLLPEKEQLLELSENDSGTNSGHATTPFEQALQYAGRVRGLEYEKFCLRDDPVTRRILEEYGAMFVASLEVVVPPVCLFTSEGEVEEFQRFAGSKAATFGADTIELQPAALDSLTRARDEVRSIGLEISPRGGVEAARRGFEDSVRLWRSRYDPAIDYWFERGNLSAERSRALHNLPLREQVSAVLELEADGIFFSKDFSKSILRSVAAPGASQHLAMLAFDAFEFRDPVIRDVLARHGWFQTVLSDLPHFTYLGLIEDELPARGLKVVEECGQKFWIPNI